MGLRTHQLISSRAYLLNHLQRLAVFGPLTDVDPCFFADRIHTDLSPILLYLVYQIGNVKQLIVRNQFQDSGIQYIHPCIYQKIIFRFFFYPFQAASTVQLAYAVRDVVLLG